MIGSSESYTTFTWDYRNRLTETIEFTAANVQTHKIVYTYDPLNQLIGRKEYGAAGSPLVEQSFYAYDDGQAILEFGGTGTVALTHRYLWGPAVDQLLADERVTAANTPGEILWALGDHLGSVRTLMNQHGVIRKETDYDAFGNVSSEINSDDAAHGYTGAVDQLFKFTGRYTDEDTGLQNNLHRWYDPKIGRWLSQDPIGFAGGDANLYRYVGNEPTGKTDPSGLEGEDEIKLLYPAAPPRAATDPFGKLTTWEMLKDSLNVRELYFDLAGYRRELVDGKWYWSSDDCSGSVVDEWRNDAERIPFSPVPVVPISLLAEGDVFGAGKSVVTDYATDRLTGAAGMLFARLPNGTFRVIDRLDDDAADFARRNAPRRTGQAIDAGLDLTGKVHGKLPGVKDLGRYDVDDLARLRNGLQQSVQKRIEMTVKKGADCGHNDRLAAEQQLIKSIEKHLQDR